MYQQWVRAILTPLRWGVVGWHRGHPLRSLCVAALKPVERRRQLLRGLAQVVPADRRELSFEASDSMVIRTVYWFGVQGYEGILADIWSQLCSESHSVLEVGGNVGLYTVIGARSTSGLYTVVEPVPEIARVLQANLSRNGITRVELLQAAVIPGPEIEDVELNVPDEGCENPVGAHLMTGTEVRGRDSQRVIKVQGLPFVQLLQGRDLVKIDAEGLEYALLACAEEQLKLHKPTLLVEVLPEAHQLATLIAKLAREAGYIIHVIPAYGSEQVVTVPAERFNAETPRQHRSKDVLLSKNALPGAIALAS